MEAPALVPPRSTKRSGFGESEIAIALEIPASSSLHVSSPVDLLAACFLDDYRLGRLVVAATGQRQAICQPDGHTQGRKSKLSYNPVPFKVTGQDRRELLIASNVRLTPLLHDIGSVGWPSGAQMAGGS